MLVTGPGEVVCSKGKSMEGILKNRLFVLGKRQLFAGVLSLRGVPSAAAILR